jgi:hypothetical protein
MQFRIRLLAGYKLISAVFAMGLLAAPAAAQQLAKSGKYAGNAAFHPVGGVEQTYELEKGHVFLLGLLHGVFLNASSRGFIDKAEVVCPRVLDIVGGVITASHGYCIVTDKDGDKAFLAWEGKDTNGPANGGGTFKWTGGTGKYSGLQGDNTFHYTPWGKAGAGVVAWEGDWRLP